VHEARAPGDYSDREGSLTTTEWSRSWLVCGAAFLATGVGLLAYIASGISLLVTAAAAAGVAAFAVIWIDRRLDDERRRALRRRIYVGVWAGLLATVAYDTSRLVLIEVTGIRFWPFDIFRVFGEALFGTAFGPRVTRIAGFLYHLANGLGFGVAYSVWWGRRGVFAGVLFAMGLELCMVIVYPGWLQMKAIGEFLQVSVIGHLVYGSVLGWSARRALNRT
jgi:hypothetical protein